MRPGDRITLLDGTGREFLTELQQIDETHAIGRVLQESKAAGEPAARQTLYQCVLKGDKLEWVLQKGTELGVSRFVPVVSERTIVRPASALLRKYGRWQSIVREAAEQSGRGLLPELAEPMTWAEALEDAEGLRLAPWERADDHPGLAQAACEWVGTERAPVNILVGPEGGLTDEEMQSAVVRGWQLVTLGPRILRAETAAIAAVSIAMSSLGELG